MELNEFKTAKSKGERINNLFICIRPTALHPKARIFLYTAGLLTCSYLNAFPANKRRMRNEK